MFSGGMSPADCLISSTWKKTFGGTNAVVGKSAYETSNGSYVITRYTESYGVSGYDVYLIKTNNNGTLVWEKTFGNTAFDSGSSVCKTSDGGNIITGYTASFGASNYDVYLFKTDADGNINNLPDY